MTWSRVFFYGIFTCTAAGIALMVVGEPLAAVPEIVLAVLCTIGFVASQDDEAS